MSGTLELTISWIWSFSNNLRRLSRAKHQLVANRLRGKQPDSLVELPVLGPHSLKHADRIFVFHCGQF